MDDMLIVLICVVSSVLSSAFFVYVMYNFRDYRITELENQVDSLIMKWNNAKGLAVQGQNKEEQMAFMAQAAEILKSEGEMKDKIIKVIALNPALAMKMASKLGIGL